MSQTFFRFFRHAFSPKYLLLTNTVSCTSLLAVGDILQQYLHGEWNPKQSKSFDGWRTFRFCVLGLVIGPANHYWFKFLDSYFIHGRKSAIVAKKVASDIAIAPAFDSFFITGVAVLEGKTVLAGLQEYCRKFVKLMTLDIVMFTPTQVINFWLLPPPFRVVYTCSVLLIYDCILSHIKHNER
uniref:Mpv17-like protein n=1 Tax=Syphacia muris TaxID=451379 RepID=A0A0N5AUH5_9BILA